MMTFVYAGELNVLSRFVSNVPQSTSEWTGIRRRIMLCHTGWSCFDPINTVVQAESIFAELVELTEQTKALALVGGTNDEKLPTYVHRDVKGLSWLIFEIISTERLRLRAKTLQGQDAVAFRVQLQFILHQGTLSESQRVVLTKFIESFSNRSSAAPSGFEREVDLLIQECMALPNTDSNRSKWLPILFKHKEAHPRFDALELVLNGDRVLREVRMIRSAIFDYLWLGPEEIGDSPYLRPAEISNLVYEIISDETLRERALALRGEEAALLLDHVRKDLDREFRPEVFDFFLLTRPDAYLSGVRTSIVRLSSPDECHVGEGTEPASSRIDGSLVSPSQFNLEDNEHHQIEGRRLFAVLPFPVAMLLPSEEALAHVNETLGSEGNGSDGGLEDVALGPFAQDQAIKRIRDEEAPVTECPSTSPHSPLVEEIGDQETRDEAQRCPTAPGCEELVRTLEATEPEIRTASPYAATHTPSINALRLHLGPQSFDHHSSSRKAVPHREMRPARPTAVHGTVAIRQQEPRGILRLAPHLLDRLSTPALSNGSDTEIDSPDSEAVASPHL